MAKSVKEVMFSTSNRVGMLEKVTQALKKARVNIQHICAWGEGGKAHFSLVTNSNARARRALSRLGIRSSEKEGLLLNLKNKIGSLERIAKRLAKAKINISCLSATTAGSRASVLFHTSNNRKAKRVV